MARAVRGDSADWRNCFGNLSGNPSARKIPRLECDPRFTSICHLSQKGKERTYLWRSLFSNIAAYSMEGLCRAFDKTEGLLLRHSILSFSPEERIDAWDAADIATRAIRYYKQQYQILAAVHEDRPHIHIHFVMNTLNYRTGKKYPGDRADYYGFLAYLGKILKPYGLKVKPEK